MKMSTIGRLCAVVVILAGLARAQTTTGSIAGTVRDETGAVLPGVQITVLNVNTGQTRTLVTDDEGRYRTTNLPVGPYEVKAELTGFQTVVRGGIVLTVGREAEVEIALKVGELSEQIVVSGEAPLVDTASSTLGGLVEQQAVVDLPLNGRSIAQLAVLQAGVYAPPGASSNQFIGRAPKFSFAGGRVEQAGFLIDGTDASDDTNHAAGGVGGEVLGVETIREFRVMTTNYTAEFGRAAAGVFNAVTKSGTNAFHGTVFEFHRNDNLDARNFFDKGPPPEFKRNQFGFSVGGPIRKDKTFFFSSWEGLRERLGVTRVDTVPNAAARQGLLPDPATGTLVNVGVAPAVRPFLALYPAPNGRDFGDGRAEFLSAFSQPTTEDFFTARIDHNFSDRDSLFGRYILDDSEAVRAPQIGELLVGFPEDNRNQFLTLEEKKIFSPAVVNVFRFAFNRTRRGANITQFFKVTPELAAIPPEQQRWSDSAGQPYSATLSVLTLSRFNTGSGFPTNSPLNIFQYSDNLDYLRGRHSLRTGVDIRRMQYNETKFLFTNGVFEIVSLRDLLLGQARIFTGIIPGASDAQRGYRQTIVGLYVQDEFKWTQRLTLNAGLRYEFSTVPTEVNGKLSQLRDPLDPAVTVGDPLFENPSLRDFGPRLGIAWDPFGDGKTSFRSGFGIFFDQIAPAFYRSHIVLNPPFFLQSLIPGPRITLPVDAAAFQAARPTLRTLDFHLKSPYTIQFNVGLQREILPTVVVEASYVGSRGVKIIRAIEANTPNFTLVNGQKFFPANAPRRNPNFANNNLRLTDTNSYYHGLLLTVQKRFSGGSRFQGSYTLSKSIDYTSGFFSASFDGGVPTTMDPLDPARDKALANPHVRHNLAFNYGYELPWGRGKRLGADWGRALEAALGGWSLNGIVSVSSGAPFTAENAIVQSRNLSSGLTQHDRPNLRPGANNNPVLGGPDRYFDPTVFELQPAGFYGNVGRNTLIGPGLVSFDFSIFKDFRVTEATKLQFRSEFFNLFNRANFSVPSRVNRSIFSSATGVINPSAGRLTTTVTTSRQIQFALKFVF